MRNEPLEPEDYAEIKRANLGGWLEFALTHGFVPCSFWHLTFDEARLGPVSPDRAMSIWSLAVRRLNIYMHGAHFQVGYKHSCFSYIVAVDYSRLGAVHLHAVVDGWVPWEQLHRLWEEYAGFAWISPINSDEDIRVALAHVVKYATKGGDCIRYWFSKKPNRSGVAHGSKRLPAA